MSTKRERTRRRRSDAVAYLETLSGSPLTLAKLLRSIRQGEEMTQSEFADQLGVSKQHLSHVENGRKVVSPERAARWAALLGYAESQFVRLALQDELERAGLRYTVAVDARPDRSTCRSLQAGLGAFTYRPKVGRRSI